MNAFELQRFPGDHSQEPVLSNAYHLQILFGTEYVSKRTHNVLASHETQAALWNSSAYLNFDRSVPGAWVRMPTLPF